MTTTARLRRLAAPTRRSLLLGLGAAALSGRPAAAEPERIVALGGAVTEILWAIGLADRIVGVDTTSTYPPEAMATRRHVGYLRALSAEGVLSLAPTLVIGVEGAGPPDALRLMREAGIPVELVQEDHSEAGVAARIRTVGRLAGRPEAAERLAAAVATDFAALAADRARIGRPARVLFVLSLQNGRTLAAGTGTAADAIIRMAGGSNVAAAMPGYKPFADEAVIAAAPEAVVAMAHTDAVDPDRLFALPAFAATPAAASRRVLRMDGQYLLGFGPRTPRAAAELLRALHPDLGLPAFAGRAAP